MGQEIKEELRKLKRNIRKQSRKPINQINNFVFLAPVQRQRKGKAKTNKQ